MFVALINIILLGGLVVYLLSSVLDLQNMFKSVGKNDKRKK